jgi:glycosyltransferase involved in cell wall biosynthesis
MTVYNGERFLADAVESVLRQTMPQLELIIVDDGSTDSSPRILDHYARLDERIRLIHQDHQGVSAAANAGVHQARYELVARSDSDDRMLPHRLEKQVAFLKQNPHVDVACSHSYFINASGKRIGASSCRIDIERGKRELKPSCFLELTQSTVMMKKHAFLTVGGYRNDIHFAEDRDLWGRFVTSGYTIACQDEFLEEYRLHAGAMTMKRARLQREICGYIDGNIKRRLQGRSELSFDDFRAAAQREPFLLMLRENVAFVALHAFKRASRHYGEGQYGRCSLSLVAAVLLNPIVIVGRAIDRMRKHEHRAAKSNVARRLQPSLQAPPVGQVND